MNRVDLTKAQRKADEIMAWLRPVTGKLAIAGSVRRKRPEVKDIEIVAVPAYREGGLFGGESMNLLGPELLRRHDAGQLGKIHQRGESFAQIEIPDLIRYDRTPACLDLFMVSAETFGYHLAIRTGPASFSQRLVTQQKRGGLLHDDAWCKGGKVLVVRDSALDPGDQPGNTYGVFYPTPEETDFLEIAGGWKDPRDRL